MNSTFKIFTYNILSSEYATPVSYPNISSSILNDNNRWKNVSQILTKEIKENSIILLQEVSERWKERIKVLTKKNNYKALITNYSNVYSGFMGNAMLIPNIYDIIKVEYIRPCSLSDEFCLSSQSEDSEASEENSEDSDSEEYLEDSLYDIIGEKPNIQIMVILKINYKSFAICTYHAPLILNDELSQLGSSICFLKAAYDFAKDLPLILAGDFNFLPTSNSYKLFEGKMTGIEEINKYEKLKSAYFEYNGFEPKYTTKFQIKYHFKNNINTFEGTLDYIFFKNVNLINCNIPLPFSNNFNKNEVFLPNKENPSDHFPMCATFEC